MPVALVIGLALIFAFTNGFQDASNSIAIVVATGSLSPRLAVTMAATLGLGGAFLGEGLARRFGLAIIDPPAGGLGLRIIGAALVAAIVWDLVTWWFGMPASSTQALIGGLTGASLAAGTTVLWSGIWRDVALPMLLSPVAGLVLAYLGMRVLIRVAGDLARRRVGPDMRRAQVAAAGAVALGNGLQDAAKTMGVILLVLTVSGHQLGPGVPWEVMVGAAVAMALGTYAGGWRIVRTLGRRIISPAPDPAQGTVAQSATAGIQYLAGALYAPVSSTHTVTAAIVGAGLTGRRSAIRWDVITQVVAVWLVNFPATVALSALLCTVALAL
nr:inorganic phosphate transporter [Ornithinimicrobium sp. F0845]